MVENVYFGIGKDIVNKRKWLGRPINIKKANNQAKI